MTSIPAQPAAAEKKLWWQVALHLDEAKLAAVNAMALNVDDPRAIIALQEVIGQAQAILLDIFVGKGLLPASQIIPPPVVPVEASVEAEASVETEASAEPPAEEPATSSAEPAEETIQEAAPEAPPASPTPPNGVPVQEAAPPNGQSDAPIAE